jgi:hypothetical protein
MEEGSGMTGVKGLSHEEKVFLAGCIRGMILEDGAVETTELDDLDSLFARLGFTDYEASLEEYEARNLEEDGFMAAARGIVNPAAQQLILDALYELLLRKSTPADLRQGIFGRLAGLWKLKV